MDNYCNIMHRILPHAKFGCNFADMILKKVCFSHNNFSLHIHICKLLKGFTDACKYNHYLHACFPTDSVQKYGQRSRIRDQLKPKVQRKFRNIATTKILSIPSCCNKFRCFWNVIQYQVALGFASLLILDLIVYVACWSTVS